MRVEGSALKRAGTSGAHFTTKQRRGCTRVPVMARSLECLLSPEVGSAVAVGCGQNSLEKRRIDREARLWLSARLTR